MKPVAHADVENTDVVRKIVVQEVEAVRWMGALGELADVAGAFRILVNGRFLRRERI